MMKEEFIKAPTLRKTKRIFIRKRYIHCVLMGLCLFVAYINRLNLSVAIIANNTSSNENMKELKWNAKERSVILGSFSGGYLIFQIPAAIIGRKISPKLLLGVTNLFSSIAVAATPLAAYYGSWEYLSVLRVVEGFCQGFVCPMIFQFASKWCPPSERGRLIAITLSGAVLGGLTTFPLTKALAYSKLGWPSVFYVSAILNLLWTIAWIWLGADSPATHNSITSEEKNYIETSLLSCTVTSSSLKIPWLDILMNAPFWALLFTSASVGFGMSIIINILPFYINRILKIDIKSNEFLSALPYLSMWILTFPICWLADCIQKKDLLSKSSIRKLWATMHLSVCSLSLFPLKYFDNDLIPVMIILVTIVSLQSFLFSGIQLNTLDLSPNFSGVLYSLTNTAETLSLLIAPLIVGLIMNDPDSKEQWWMVFFVYICVSLAGNLLFLIFGSTNVQPWNTPK